MKISLQTLAVLLILPLAACNTVQPNQTPTQFDTFDYMQGISPDAPILQTKRSIFGTMNF